MRSSNPAAGLVSDSSHVVLQVAENQPIMGSDTTVRRVDRCTIGIWPQ